ncbi:hypothetical protein HK102_008744, partial [Quaeritorhiza haematococci]
MGQNTTFDNEMDAATIADTSANISALTLPSPTSPTPSDMLLPSPSSPSPPTSKTSPLLDLPTEIWCRIFGFLESPKNFATSCRFFSSVTSDPHARARLFVTRFGRPLALYHAFIKFRKALTPDVGKLVLAAGGGLPRFLVQIVDREYHRSDRNRKPVTHALLVFFLSEGLRLYGDHADFKDDDAARFERLVYSSTGSTSTSLPAIRSLIVTYKYTPLKGMGSPLDETVYVLSKLDMTLVDAMVANGLDLRPVNDLVMERLLWRADITEAMLQAYLDHGFKLTPLAVKKGLQMARPAALEALRARVPADRLLRFAEETVVDMMGPTSRHWHFTAEAADHLVAAFPISEEIMERAILMAPHRSNKATTKPDDSNGSSGSNDFPSTRCYFKSNPCPVWRWILRTFGPTHRFTTASFDDALSRAVADRELHALHDIYLDAGVRFRPRHVKILACRVLHRDMTGNALHLMRVMRTQLANGGALGSHHTTTSPTSPTSTTPFTDDTDPTEWLTRLREEIVDNPEWIRRMKTTQLEGSSSTQSSSHHNHNAGGGGGAYRLSRPPEDGLRFLDEAKDLVAELGAVVEKAELGSPYTWSSLASSSNAAAGGAGSGSGKDRKGK